MRRVLGISAGALLLAMAGCSGPADDSEGAATTQATTGDEEPASPSETPGAIEATDTSSAQVHLVNLENEGGQGILDPAIPRRNLESRLRAITACYREALTQHPDAAGFVQLDFTIATDGTVSEASVSEDGVGVPEIASCLTTVARNMRFVPGPEGGDVVYGYSFRFTPR